MSCCRTGTLTEKGQRWGRGGYEYGKRSCSTERDLKRWSGTTDMVGGPVRSEGG